MHKKTLNLAAVCIVILLVVFVYTQKKEGGANKKGNIAIDETGPANAIAGAMITSEDSYQEIVLDSVTKQQLGAFEKIANSYQKKEGDTLSDKISKDIFSQYIEYNSSGQYDSANLKKITEQNVQNQPLAKANVPMKYIKLVPPSVTNLKAYGNNIAAIQVGLDKALGAIAGQPNQDVYIQGLYITTARLFMKISVPQSISTHHINIINSYFDYAYAFTIIRLQDKDPAKALLGVQKAKESNETLVKSFEAIRNIIILNKIQYTIEDYAYKWINGGENSTIIKTE